MTFEGLLIHNIYKRTPSSSQNDLGEWTYSWTAGSTAIECRVNPISNEERLMMAGQFDDVKYKVYMDADETLSRGDQVTYSTEIYEVNEVLTDSSSHNKTAFLKLIT